jgi:hypothetical protein
MPGPSLTLVDGTLLVLTPLSGQATVTLTPFAARGLTQTLEVINNSQWLRRDVNGFLRNVSDSRFRKYKSTITCRDGESPALDGAWIGEVVDVSCVAELSFPNGGTPQRTPVAGSERVQGDFTYYRPMLTCLVESISVSFQEYAAIAAWSVSLSEI